MGRGKEPRDTHAGVGDLVAAGAHGFRIDPAKAGVDDPGVWGPDDGAGPIILGRCASGLSLVRAALAQPILSVAGRTDQES